jgi:hypothetical protein
LAKPSICSVVDGNYGVKSSSWASIVEMARSLLLVRQRSPAAGGRFGWRATDSIAGGPTGAPGGARLDRPAAVTPRAPPPT